MLSHLRRQFLIERNFLVKGQGYTSYVYSPVLFLFTQPIFIIKFLNSVCFNTKEDNDDNVKAHPFI